MVLEEIFVGMFHVRRRFQFSKLVAALEGHGSM
jgi:hypothetical protein